MRRVLGDEHPTTVNARSNLAQTLYAQGNLAGARSHQEAVLNALRPVLGDEHPVVLTAKSNLAQIIWAQSAMDARETTAKP